MRNWYDISTAPKDGSQIIIGWAPSESVPDGDMTFAKWIGDHYNGPGWYGEQSEETWGPLAYENPTHWTSAPKAPPA